MKRIAVGLTFLALVAGPVLAQENAVDIEAEMAEASRKFERSLEASAAMIKSQRASLASLPSPTADEAALLEQDSDDLGSLMMAEELECPPLE